MSEYSTLVITHAGIRVAVYPSFRPNGDIVFNASAVEVDDTGQQVSFDGLAQTTGHSTREKARLQIKRELTARAKKLLEFVDADEKSVAEAFLETQP